MRTLIDIDEKLIRELDRLGAEARRSRAALIREAVAKFIEASRKGAESEAFGLWGKSKIDGLAYQQRIRAEW
ncbi:MAG: ribbon-helix-helix protein, CopG family [Parvularculaceae bacterium]